MQWQVWIAGWEFNGLQSSCRPYNMLAAILNQAKWTDTNVNWITQQSAVFQHSGADMLQDDLKWTDNNMNSTNTTHQCDGSTYAPHHTPPTLTSPNFCQKIPLVSQEERKS